MNKEQWHHLIHRSANTNKYNNGHILVIGGSPNMTGAPILAARAALRTGAGLVTVASDKETIALVDRDITEIMTLSLPLWTEIKEIKGTVKNFIDDRRVTGIVVGPGLPTEADAVIRSLAASLSGTTILIDAEAIRAFHGHLPELRNASKVNSIIITPHPGEFAFLTDTELIKNKTIEKVAVQEFATKHALTVVLKHAHTLVADKDGETHTNQTGNAGLATAGTGDVLSGVIAALTAQGVNPYEAAVMGVYLHGLAGDIAADAKTEPGMIASDIINAIPDALKMLDT